MLPTNIQRSEGCKHCYVTHPCTHEITILDSRLRLMRSAAAATVGSQSKRARRVIITRERARARNLTRGRERLTLAIAANEREYDTDLSLRPCLCGGAARGKFRSEYFLPSSPPRVALSSPPRPLFLRTSIIRYSRRHRFVS